MEKVNEYTYNAIVFFVLDEFLPSYYAASKVKEENVRKYLHEYFRKESKQVHSLWNCLRRGIKHDIVIFLKTNLPKLPLGFIYHLAFELFRYQSILNNVKVEKDHNDYINISSEIFDAAKRLTFTNPYFDMVSVSRAFISFDGDCCELHSIYGDELHFIRFDQLNKFDKEAIKSRQFPSFIQFATHGTSLLWHHQVGMDHLRVFPPGKCVLPTQTKTNRSLLVIGSFLLYNNYIIDIHHVIAVDVVDNLCSNGCQSFAILIEGSLSSIQGLDRSVSNRNGKTMDGKSQYDGNSGNESEEKELSDSEDEQIRLGRQPANASCQRRFYVVFGLTQYEMVSIENIIPLQNLFLDQRPCGLLYQERNIAVVYGTNGLLGVINLVEKESLPIDSEMKHPNIESKECHGVFFQSLTKDYENPILKTNSTNFTNQSNHLNNATITAVTFTPGFGILVSGDSFGCICVWNLYTTHSDIYEHPLIASYQLNTNKNQEMMSKNVDDTLYHQIHSLSISTTGKLIAVGLFDRCLLLSINTETSTIIMKGFLDIVTHLRANYHVRFTCRGQIVIWRIMNSKGFKMSFEGTASDDDEVDVSQQTNTHRQDAIQLGINRDYVDNEHGSSITTWIHYVDECDYDYQPMPFVIKQSNENVVMSKYASIHSNNGIGSSISSSFEESSETFTIKLFHQQHTSKLSSHRNDKEFPFLRVSRIRSNTEFSNITQLVEQQPQQQVTTHKRDNSLLLSDEERDTYLLALMHTSFERELIQRFVHGSSITYKNVIPIISIVLAAQETPSIGLISSCLDIDTMTVMERIEMYLSSIFQISNTVVSIKEGKKKFLQWLSSPIHCGNEFAIDISIGHNYLCALYLKYCGNKSVAVEHSFQEYLRMYGSFHLRKCSRGLRQLTSQIRKIDETANIRGTIPRQVGYIVGLTEIYARRVGLCGRLPSEIGELIHLRVLSMGNNQICGEIPSSFVNLIHLQRIVLHQNRLTGKVPECM